MDCFSNKLFSTSKITGFSKSNGQQFIRVGLSDIWMLAGLDKHGAIVMQSITSNWFISNIILWPQYFHLNFNGKTKHAQDASKRDWDVQLDYIQINLQVEHYTPIYLGTTIMWDMLTTIWSPYNFENNRSARVEH